MEQIGHMKVAFLASESEPPIGPPSRSFDWAELDPTGLNQEINLTNPTILGSTKPKLAKQI